MKEQDRIDKQTPEVYQRIINVLSVNEKEVKNISVFKDSLDKLKSFHSSMVQLSSVPDNKANNVSQNKNFQRDYLIKKATQALIILKIYAYDKKIKSLARKLQKLDTEKLKSSTDIELIRISRNLWSYANKYGKYSLAFVNKIKPASLAGKSKAMAKLQDKYGLTQVMIKELEDANIKFIDSLLHFRDEKDERKKLKKEIGKIYSKADKLIENKIDQFVLLFENESPDFYKTYQESRIKPEERKSPSKDVDETIKEPASSLHQENQAKVTETKSTGTRISKVRSKVASKTNA